MVDGRMRTLAPRAGNTVALGEGRDAAQPGQRRPAARRRPARELPDPRPRRRRRPPGAASPYDIEAVRRHDAGRRACRRAWPTACASAPERDRRTTPPSRPQAGRPTRPRRAPARSVLPLHGQGPADGQGSGQRPDDAGRAGVRGGPRPLLRPPAGERGGARRAAGEDQGAGDLQLGRDQLVGLRDRGDPARPDPRGAAALALGVGSAPRSRSCSSPSPSRTARSASPTRPAAGRTPCPGATSAGRSASSRPRRC